MNLYYSKLPTFFTFVKGDCVSSIGVQEANKNYHVAHETSCTIDGSPKTLLVPAVPSQDITPSDLASCGLKNKAIPEVLLQPLLKHSSQESGLQGYHSGRRSALACIDGVWYRFKGCGDLTNGIAVRKAEYCDDSFAELRGVQYENTTVRELYITQLVNNELIQNGLVPANESVAYWKYTTQWPVPCTCAIFTTRGDKRLNDHVLFGLESLLPLLMDELDAAKLIEKLPPSRVSDNEVLPTWLAALDEDLSSLVDLRGCELSEHSPSDVLQLIPKDESKHVPEILTVLQQGMLGSSSFLASLYWRLGWEVGRILRVIHMAGISWGTYPDKLGIHCNAHPNNLVLLNEGSCLLAPLDFDMAFTEKSVTSLTYVDSFSDLLAMEVRSMRLSLAGDSELNSGTTGVASLGEKYLALKWCLRDTLVKAFDSGYNESSSVEFPLIDSDVSHALLKLALVVSSDIVA